MAKSYKQRNIDMLRETTKCLLDEKTELEGSIITPIVCIDNDDNVGVVHQLHKKGWYGFKRVWFVNPEYFNTATERWISKALTSHYGTSGITGTSALHGKALDAALIGINQIYSQLHEITRVVISDTYSRTQSYNALITWSVDDMKLPSPFKRVGYPLRNAVKRDGGMIMALDNMGLNIGNIRKQVVKQWDTCLHGGRRHIVCNIPSKVFHTCFHDYDYDGNAYRFTCMQMQAANQFIVNMTDLMGAISFQNGMQSQDMLVINGLVWQFTDTSFDAHASLHLVDIL
jgi:hypothetical protein